MKKPTVAHVARYGCKEDWEVAMYWSRDHESCPHDYDLLLTASQWRKLSKLRSPKMGEVLKVQITFEILESRAS